MLTTPPIVSSLDDIGEELRACTMKLLRSQECIADKQSRLGALHAAQRYASESQTNAFVWEEFDGFVAMKSQPEGVALGDVIVVDPVFYRPEVEFDIRMQQDINRLARRNLNGCAVVSGHLT